MLDDELMHWEEGLFVEPQHLQTMQRQALQRSAVERRLMTPFPYGVVKADLDEGALSVQGGARVEFRSLHAVMENGWVVEHGRNAAVRPLRLRENLGGDTRITVCLVVQKWQPGTAVVRSNGQAFVSGDAAPPDPQDGASRRDDDVTVFRINRYPDVSDENTGTGRADITTRRFDARLVAIGPGDAWPDATTSESLPVLRLIGSNPPRIDRDYAPPCFHLKGSGELERAVRRVSEAVAAKRDEIASEAASAGANPTRADVEQLLRFQALNRHGATLSHALKDESLSAYAAYQHCLELLATLRGSRLGSEGTTSTYNHREPWPPFLGLTKSLEDELQLRPEEARGYALTPMGAQFGAIQSCQGDFNLVTEKGWSCVLAVAADTPEDLARVVRSEMIHVGSPLALNWVRSEFYIPWKVEERPTGLRPIHREGGATQFLALRVNPEHPHWLYVAQEGRLAVVYANIASDAQVQLRFKLYMRPRPPRD